MDLWGQVRGLVWTARPRQWTKNLLVLAAPAAAGAFDEGAVRRDSLMALVAFCLASAATYVVNDLRDIERDRAHPTKRHRPLPSGRLGVGTALVAAPVFALAAGGLALAVSWQFLVCVVGYMAMTTSYSLYFKHVPVVELVLIAGGFVLRAVAGGVAASVPVSAWFFVVVSFGSLLMATAKRTSELGEVGGSSGSTRPVLAAYGLEYLREVETLAVAVTLIGYCLWAFESAVATRTGLGATFFKVSVAPFVMSLLRFLLLAHRGEVSEPELVFFRDHTLRWMCLGWVAVYGGGVLAS